MSRVLVVGGGIVGTTLAVEALDRGHEVVQVERDEEPRGASLRNFGLIWICGRAAGRELERALEGRGRWELLTRRAPAIGFRPTGSLVLATSRAELDLAEAACSRDDAQERGFRMLTPEDARAHEPGLGDLLGALHSPLDAVVEPSAALSALRSLAMSSGRYRFVAGRTIVGRDEMTAWDHRGERHDADLVALCTGVATELFPADLVEGAALSRRNLQMLGTAPCSPTLRTAIAGGDAMRYYPAFDLPERERLPPAENAVDRFAAQLLIAPRADGRLTIGDTHIDDEPGRFGSEEEADGYMLAQARAAISTPLPEVERRWTGTYLRRADGTGGALLELTSDGALVIAGVGGMGMTAAPVFAAEGLDLAGL